MTIKISQEFTDTPGPRYKKDGQFSGEEFRESILLPKFKDILNNNNENLIIDFDGGYGYPSSFLEEAFGGLARKFGADVVLSKIEFISKEEPALVDEVKDYIRKTNLK